MMDDVKEYMRYGRIANLVSWLVKDGYEVAVIARDPGVGQRFLKAVYGPYRNYSKAHLTETTVTIGGLGIARLVLQDSSRSHCNALVLLDLTREDLSEEDKMMPVPWADGTPPIIIEC